MKLLLIAAILCIQFSRIIIAEKLKLVCFYPGWLLNATGDSRYIPEYVDPTLCTQLHHEIYFIDEEHNVIRNKLGPQPDLYRRLLALKQKNSELKVIASLGGWPVPDTESPKFSRLVNNQSKWNEFIRNTIDYLHNNQYDGLDIDWEFPVCWAGNCTMGPKSDRENLGKFIKVMKTEFNKQSPRLSLSADLSAEKVIAEKSYDFASFAENLDYINIMTYDDAGWGLSVPENKTGHHSRFNFCIETMQYFVSKGLPKEKLLLGAPFYGHVFELVNKSKHKIGDPVVGPGHTPNGTDFFAFYQEMCELVKFNNWTKEQADSSHDPIAYHDNLWVGYDDPYAAYDKSKWVRDNGFGGILALRISEDDFRKQCCSVDYPMLRAVNHGLYGTGQGPETYECEHK